MWLKWSTSSSYYKDTAKLIYFIQKIVFIVLVFNTKTWHLIDFIALLMTIDKMPQ